MAQSISDELQAGGFLRALGGIDRFDVGAPSVGASAEGGFYVSFLLAANRDVQRALAGVHDIRNTDVVSAWRRIHGELYAGGGLADFAAIQEDVSPLCVAEDAVRAIEGDSAAAIRQSGGGRVPGAGLGCGGTSGHHESEGDEQEAAGGSGGVHGVGGFVVGCSLRFIPPGFEG